MWTKSIKKAILETASKSISQVLTLLSKTSVSSSTKPVYTSLFSRQPRDLFQCLLVSEICHDFLIKLQSSIIRWSMSVWSIFGTIPGLSINKTFVCFSSGWALILLVTVFISKCIDFGKWMERALEWIHNRDYLFDLGVVAL